MTALVDAVYSENFAQTIELIRAGADPNESDDIDRTALMVACGMGHTRFISALLFHGAEMTSGVRSVLALHREPGSEHGLPDELVAYVKGADVAHDLRELEGAPFLDALDSAIDSGAYPCAVLRRLVTLLTGRDGELASRASLTLQKILERGWAAEPVVQALGEKLGDAEDNVRLSAVNWLFQAARGGASLVAVGPDLARSLDRTRDNSDLMKLLIVVLGFAASHGFDVTRSKPRIEELLAHEDAATRNFTVRMLMRFRAGGGDTTTFHAALAPLANDQDRETRESVAALL